MAKYVNNRSPRQQKKKSGGGLFPILIFLGIATSIFGSSLLQLVLGSVMISLDVLLLASPFLIIYFLIRAIKKKNKKNKENSRAANRLSTAEFLSLLKHYVDANGCIDINDETYLKIEDRENISLNTVSIYMRNEYIASLSDYSSVFPSGFDALIATVSKQFKTSVKKKNVKQETPAPKTPVMEVSAPKVEKNCEYYIKKYNGLTAVIKNEKINKAVASSIDYLSQISKVEKEYPESKSKTVKLYQYYLPMYLDILENYIRLSGDVVDKEEFGRQEEHLEKTAYIINEALRTISDGLVDDYYTNFKVDMKTLESVLKKDGLVDSSYEGQEETVNG